MFGLNAGHRQAEIRVGCVRLQHVHHLALRDDGNAVADGAQLHQFGRNHHDGHALFAVEPHQRLQHQLFGADVNAARRFGDEQQFRIHRQRARNADLLLVAAGERARMLLRGEAADIQFLDDLVGIGANRLAVAQMRAEELFGKIAVDLHRVEYDIVFNRFIQQQAYAAPVLRHDGHAVFERLPRVVQRGFFAKQLDLALARINAHHAVGNADLALSGQAADAEDFALPHFEGNVVDHLARHIHGQMTDLERNRRILRQFARFGGDKGRFALAADHHLRKLSHIGVLRAALGDELAVAQDGNPVRRVDDLVKSVRDKDDSDAARGDILHHLEQLSRLALGQNGSRFVKDQQLHALFVDLAGDFHKLHVTDRQSGHTGVFVDGHADAVQRAARVFGHRFHIQRFQVLAEHAGNRAGTADFAVELDVFGDGKARQQHELLMHHADALLHRVVRRGDGRLLAVEIDFAAKSARFVNDGHAEKHVHQRALARAVFAQQRVDFARLNLERHAGKHGVFAVLLGDVPHFKDVFRGQFHSSFETAKATRLNACEAGRLYLCLTDGCFTRRSR